MRSCARRSLSVSARAPGVPPLEAAPAWLVRLPEVVEVVEGGVPVRAPVAVPSGGAAGLPDWVPAGLPDGVAAGFPDCAPAGLAPGGDADGLPVCDPGDEPPPIVEPPTPVPEVPPDEEAPPALPPPALPPPPELWAKPAPGAAARPEPGAP